MKKKILSQAIAMTFVACSAVTTSAAYAGGNADGWSGFYMKAGISATEMDEDKQNVYGYQDGSDFYLPDPSGNSSYNLDSSSSSQPAGFGGLIAAGFDSKIADSTLLGFIAQFDMADSKSKATGLYDAGGYDYTLSDTTTVRNAFSVGAKLTQLVTDKTAIYVTGGVSLAQIETSSDFTNVSNAYNISAGSTDTTAGGFVGVGVEYRITKALGVALDYRYTNYGSVDKKMGYYYNGGEEIAVNRPDSSSDDITTNSVSLALTYRF